jgi:hypothetical protein
VNATSGPALLLGVNTAPVAVNTYEDLGFIFNNPYEFKRRYRPDEDYFTPRDALEPHPVHGRAMLRSNLERSEDGLRLVRAAVVIEKEVLDPDEAVERDPLGQEWRFVAKDRAGNQVVPGSGHVTPGSGVP